MVRSPGKTTVTLTADVPAGLAFSLGLVPTDQQSGDVLALHHPDALALVDAGVARFGSAARDATTTPTIGAPGATIPALDADKEKYVPSRLSDTALRAAFVTIVSGLSTSTSAGTANAALIQAALDAAVAAGGGTVVVPAGTWTSAPLRLRTNVTLSGLGRWGTVLRLANGANTHFITLFDGNTEMAGLVDLRLDCNGANQTGGNGVHLDNASFTNSRSWPSAGDPNHYLRRVMIHDAKGHGVYTVGTWSQSHFDGVFVYTSGLNNFRVESPDNFFYNCVSAKAGAEGFYFASNSNHAVNCKSWLSGAVDATNGQGYVVSGVDRIDLIGCEAQDNRKHGLSLVTTTQANIVGFRANRNGLGAAGTGGVGDGMFASGLTNSRIEVVAYDHNNGGLKQRWGYNLGAGNDGNIVTFVIGVNQDSSVPGIGSWGPGSLVAMTWLGKPVAQPVPPVAATTQAGTAYTLALADMGTVVESNNAAAVTLTVPTDAAVAFPIGTVIQVVQYGAGTVTIAGAGVTLDSRGGALRTSARYGVVSLRKRAVNEWVVSGDLIV